ncbi:MAG: hypothetical protein JNL32_03120 [Candidatus Kapabacteria bacterium]|nr:hypothetical protein [Candidatus Kapabacteria bacterium]
MKFIALFILAAGIGSWFALPSPKVGSFELTDSYIDTTQPSQPRLININGQPSIQMIKSRTVQLNVSTTSTDSNMLKQVGKQYTDLYNKKLGGDSVIVQTIVQFFHPDSLRDFSPQELMMTRKEFHRIINRMQISDYGSLYVGFSPMLRFISEAQGKVPEYIYLHGRQVSIPTPGIYKQAMIMNDVKTITEQLRQQKK